MTPELPELPEPDGSAPVVVGQIPIGPMVADVTKEIDAWSRELVEAYALQYGQECARLATIAERERCAKIADDAYVDGDSERGVVAQEIAADIRREPT